jgi:hypothetical protein
VRSEVQLLPDPPVIQGGAIAQLGERLVCNQKVAGSIPAGSTRFAMPAHHDARDDPRSSSLKESDLPVIARCHWASCAL